MQVAEQTHLNHAVGVLLHPDPQERAQVADETRRTWEEMSRGHVIRDMKSGRSITCSASVCVGPTCTAALHELEQDINTHCSRQSAPAAAISQFIH